MGVEEAAEEIGGWPEGEWETVLLGQPKALKSVGDEALVEVGGGEHVEECLVG